MGNLAVRLQKRIEWDAAAMKATNAPEADPLIRKTYRDGLRHLMRRLQCSGNVAVLRACSGRLTSVLESCLIMPPSLHRLLIDPPGSGAWNMAVDETLLEWAAERGGCAWRFYQWSEPTLSLGYFQAFDADAEKDAEKSCVPVSAVVRRLTGGGAILHDRELTYSLVVPAGHALAARRETLYDAVHRSLIETLAGFGVTAVLCAPIRRALLAPILFLCFQRRASGDVLVGQTKIAGSAQRRRRGAVLQHGSVLLRRSPAAPRVAGLGRRCRRDRLRGPTRRGMAAAVGRSPGHRLAARPTHRTRAPPRRRTGRGPLRCRRLDE